MKRTSVIIAFSLVFLVSTPLALLGQSREGITLFAKALEIQKRARSEEDLKHALNIYSQALDLMSKTWESRECANALNNMALILRDFSRYQESIKLCERAVAIFRKLGDAAGESMALSSMAGICHFAGRSQEALKLCNESWNIDKKNGNLAGQARDLAGIAAVYDSLGQYQKAMEMNEAALPLYSKLGDVSGRAVVLGNLGVSYSKLGQYDRSSALYKQSRESYQKAGDLGGEAILLNNWAAECWQVGKLSEAVELFDEALSIEKTLGKAGDHIWANKIEVFLDMGETERVETMLRHRAHPRANGRLALMKKDFRAAHLSYQKVLDLGNETGNADYVFCGHVGMGLASEGLEDNPDAARHFEKAVAMAEEARESLPVAARTNFYEGFEVHFRRILCFEGLCRVLLKNHEPLRSLKAAEYTKARLFAESLVRRAEESDLGIPPVILSRDANVNEKLASVMMGLRKAREQGTREAIATLERESKEVRAELDTHIRKLRQGYPLFAATKYPQPMDLKDSALREDEWLIEYQVTDSGVCIYLVRSKQIVTALFRPIERKQLDGLVRKFLEHMEGVNAKNYQARLKSFDFSAGKKLFDVCLGDVLSELPSGVPLIVVPDGSLGVLPFEMLVMNHGGKIVQGKKFPSVSGAEFFGDRNPISYSQSITALTLARTLGKEKTSGNKLLVIADPVFDISDLRVQKDNLQFPHLSRIAKELNESTTRQMVTMIAVEDAQGTSGSKYPRLKETENLANMLRTLYSERADIHTGLSATKETFLRRLAPQLEQYREIVFATHGYFGKNLDGITEPLLMLTAVPPGTDGCLKLSEVTGLRMNADLVALTACMSGLGKTISGEGVMGMGRAFQYAGAKSVLMSLWSVQEDASVKLVEAFFRHINDGNSKLEAIRQARDEIRKDGYDHPYFWAPFILVGEVGTEPAGLQTDTAPRVASALPPSKKTERPLPPPKIAAETKQKPDPQHKPEPPVVLMSPNSRDLAKDTELIRAAQQGDVSRVKKLLAEGADPMCTDPEYRATPLHWASFKGNEKVVALLLKQGVNVNAVNKDSRTPLMVAAGTGRRDIVELLLRSKADKRIKDKGGKTALDSAQAKRERSVVKMLQEQ